MKRILLISLLVPGFGCAMEAGKLENPAIAQQVKKEDAGAANTKQEVATSSSNSTHEKKGFLARCFACCNGKAETK